MSEKLSPTIESITHQIICLRSISKLLSDSKRETTDVMNILVHLLPEGWQYPSDACARVIWENKEVQSANFKETKWAQRAEIAVGEENAGVLEVYYLEDKPDADEGPFLLDERSLIDTVAAEVGSYLERKKGERIREQLLHELELYGSLLRHDLRNDLSVIIGNVEIARMTIANRDDLLDQLLTSTEAVCERMLGLLRAFGTATKVSSTNPVDFINEICDQAQIASMGMKVEISIDDEARDVRIPTSKLLPLVFDNLLRNAAVHAGTTPTVTITIARKGNVLRIIVADDGPGIAKEIRGSLFQKGVSTSGGGLGLYLSKQVVENMEGSIQLVESKSKMGATFEILLPTTQ